MSDPRIDRILDELWEALHIAASREEIPIEAQLRADIIEDMIIALVPQDTD